MRPLALISFQLFPGDHSDSHQLESVALRISYTIDPYSVAERVLESEVENNKGSNTP